MPRAILTVALLGVAIYLVVRLVQSRGGGDRPAPPPGPVAPDDDPSFLHNLDQRLWREGRENRGGNDKPGPDPAPGPAPEPPQ